MAAIEGHVEDGWGKAADAFRRNFDEFDDLGAAVSVYHEGQVVIDLWGGVADSKTGSAWNQDTIVNIFSTSKGVLALCALMLVDRGQLDLDARVVDYWPEFGAEGKDGIPVHWLLSHRSGLPVFDDPPSMTAEEAAAWFPIVRALEAQKPLWEPGTECMVHGVTMGNLVGEVIRRIAGKTVGQFMATEMSGPLGLSLWCGLPQEEEHRVTLIVGDKSMEDRLVANFPPDSVALRALTVNGAWPVSLVTEDGGGMNSRVVRGGEFPACAMTGDARSLARMYAASVGEVDGIRLVGSDLVERATVNQTAGIPVFGGRGGPADQHPLGLGFLLSSPMMPGVGPRSFGDPGAGGSVAFGDIDASIGFAYVMNKMMGYMDGDPRAPGLMKAVQEILG